MLCWCFGFVALVSGVLGAPTADLVDSIPGFSGSVSFKTYAGYLDTINGKLFYIFTESSNNPSTDPVVLWLNGGPGCSSMLGAFIEMGPFHPYNMGNSAEYNPYSWNQFTSMLFIESPPCVGFSYPHNMNCSQFYTGDNKTAHDNYGALQTFFTDKFPEYRTNDFYVSGESYGGHYVPQLAVLITQMNPGQPTDRKINLKGAAIGNPYTDRDSNFFKGWLEMSYALGFISPADNAYLTSGPCANLTLTPECENMTDYFFSGSNGAVEGNINVYDYDVTYNCNSRSRQEVNLFRYVYNAPSFRQLLINQDVWAYPYTPCNEMDLTYYLNREDVQTAFHVNMEWMADKAWSACSDILFLKTYDSNQTDHAVSQVPHYPVMLNAGLKVMVYSGNNDLVCAYTGTRYWVYEDQTDFPTSAKGNALTNWTAWYVANETGGWYQQWEKFTFLVVRDAGHEVPEYQPSRAYSMFYRFFETRL